MGQIFAHYTCSRVMWEEDEEGFPFEEPTEEHGWIDRRWSSTQLYESRNDVSPVINLDEESEELPDEVRDALGWLDGGYEDNGNGTFYASESYQPYTEPWHYSYAIHFSRKSRDHATGEWVERSWHPVRDGGISLKGNA